MSVKCFQAKCENAYQIDVSTAEGWKEYQRIMIRRPVCH